jgi:hypothetical protein
MNCFNTLIGPLRWGAASPRERLLRYRRWLLIIRGIARIMTHGGIRCNVGSDTLAVRTAIAVIILRIIAQFSAAARGYVRSTAIR